MKRWWTVLSSVLVVSTVAQAQIQFRHIQSVDLSSYFPSGGQQGVGVSDVAFDGRNLYVAGFSPANSLSEPVGVLKIENALAPDPNSWGYTPLISLNQAGQSRVSYVVYHNGFLYLGTGLGDSSNNSAQTGIRKFDANTGTPVSNWNGTGVVLPSDLSNSQRAECIEIDPGYQGSSPSLAVTARGRGLIFRRDFNTGSALPNILALPTRPDNSTTTGHRDITFSPEGDAYLRVDNSVFYAQRTADNTVSGGVAFQILDFSSDNAFQVLINIHYLRVGATNFLILNRRTGSADTRIPKVLIYEGNGASWAPYSAQPELTGDEPLPGGTTPSPFAFDIFNFTSGVGPDPSQGDVNLDGVVDDADLLQILFDFGSTNRNSDVNGDGVVDDADLLTVLFNFGSNPQALYLFVVSTDANYNDRLDIYRVEQ